MALSIKPQELAKKSVSAPSYFTLSDLGGFSFLAALALLLSIGAVWGGLKFYSINLNNKLDSLNSDIQALARTRSPQIESQLLVTVARVNHIEELLKNHKDGSGVFGLLGNDVQPNVRFSDLSADFEKNSVSITVHAPDFDAIAQQMLAFQNDQRVVSVVSDLLSESTQAQEVSANFTIQLKQDVFAANR